MKLQPSFLDVVIIFVLFPMVVDSSFIGMVPSLGRSGVISPHYSSFNTWELSLQRKKKLFFHGKSFSYRTILAAAAVGPTKKEPRINASVRQHMELLEDKLGDIPSSKNTTIHWKKTRAYLYRCSAISTKQINSVIDTLLAYPMISVDLVRSIIQQSPRILRKNPKTHIEPTMDFLLDHFGEEMLIEALNRNPDLLLLRDTGYNGDELELVQVFLQNHLGMTKNQISKLKKAAPRIFQIRVSKLLAMTNYMLQLLGPEGEESSSSSHSADNAAQQRQMKKKKILSQLIISHPNLLQLTVEGNLKPRIEFLRERCHLNDNDISSLVKSCSAGILGLSVEDNLSAKLDVLQTYLSPSDTTSDDDLRKCLVQHPQILGLSLDNLHSKLLYFSAIDESLPSRFLTRAPAVFSLSLSKNIIPKLEYLSRIWGVSNDVRGLEEIPFLDSNQGGSGGKRTQNQSKNLQLGSLLYEYPTILTLSLENNILPTVDFYNQTGYIHLDQEWRLQDPQQQGLLRGRYLAASLYKRLLPRWHFAQSIQQEQAKTSGASGNENDTTVKIPLHLLVSGSDEAFCHALGEGCTKEEYEGYKTDSFPRIKFSNQFATWLRSGTPIETN
jgi:hypothetical protein